MSSVNPCVRIFAVLALLVKSLSHQQHNDYISCLSKKLIIHMYARNTDVIDIPNNIIINTIKTVFQRIS